MVVQTDQPFNFGDLATACASFRHARTVAPLSCVRAWHTEHGTSQRSALQALQDHKTVIVSGGNRSGKTYLLRAALVALVLGSDHPHARLFWVNNGCDPDAFPRGPGEAYLVALSSNDSVTYHRNQVAELLPNGGEPPVCHWYNRNGKGQSRVRISVPGYDREAVIWFKSEDQGRDKFQGSAVRAILHDEEGDSPEVWNECSARLIDLDGWQLMANTPLRGRTWVWETYVRQPVEGVAYCEIWTEHNPFLPSNALEKLRKLDKAAARTRGAWEVAEGLVFGGTDELEGWTRARHVLTRAKWAQRYPGVPFGEIPDDWPRFRCQDWGFNNPGVAQWYAVDPEDRIILYRQIYAKGWDTRRWAAAIIRAEGGRADHDDAAQWTLGNEDVQLAWADPAGAEQMATMRRVYGLRYRKGIKDWAQGRAACYRVLQPLDDGTPGFSVLEGAAPDFVTEIEGYRYPDRQRATRNSDEKPVKKDDHAMDAWRYAMVGITRWMR